MTMPIIRRLLDRLAPHTRRAADNGRLLSQIREQAKLLRGVTPEQLAETARRQRRPEGRPVASCIGIINAFAAVVEAVRRVHGMELYDVQLLAGLAMARPSIVEMQTGEGKTLAAALAAYLHALDGRGVHVATANAYLAGRDFELLAPVYRAIGVTAGLLPEGASHAEKRAAYACDITYGTGYEFGFDYLREQLGLLQQRQAALGDRYRALLRGEPEAPRLGARRGLAIVDEIDSVLLDEACTPLILSDAAGEENVVEAAYEQALHVAATLEVGRDFVIDNDRSRTVAITEQGRRRCYQAISAESSPSVAGPWSDSVQQALVALHLLRRDVDYVINRGRIVYVDAATGRLCPDRTWQSGLQQFLELKEGLPLTPIRPAAARITRQRYFLRYEMLAGMTGTAAESGGEFREVYGLRVAMVPPRLTSRRVETSDRIFIDDLSRWRAIEAEILRLHATGRPLLIGCRTIDKSQELAERLVRLGIEHQLLNGKQTASEAEIVARCGRRGAVTIATNMAGRGTDIKLADGVAELGGMHLIAVERNDSLRVDRQLTGRVGRQGDPGSCQFFVSADDALFQRHGIDLSQRIKTLPHAAGEISADLSGEIREVQLRAEAAACRLRQELAASDTWRCDELAELLQ